MKDKNNADVEVVVSTVSKPATGWASMTTEQKIDAIGERLGLV